MNVFVQITGWTLIHFVWQGAVIGLGVATLLRLTRRRSPNLRYLVACAGLVTMLAAPLATLELLRPIFGLAPAAASNDVGMASMPRADLRRTIAPNEDTAAVTRTLTHALRGILDGLPGSPLDGVHPRSEARPSASVSASAGGSSNLEEVRIDQVLRAVTFAWFIGVAVLLGRMGGGWWQVRRLHQITMTTRASPWQAACRRIAYRLGLPAAAHVVESTLVEVPTLVGWIRPAILLPVAAIAALTPGQVEAILAHELAHIRRHDYAVNLLQTLAETLLFYHPAVWWVSNRIRAEREHCCDEIAVAVCGDRVGYARALAQLEAWRTANAMVALAATGGPLVDRVQRILRVRITEQPSSQSWAGTIVLTVLFTVGAGGIQHLSWMSPQADARASSAEQPPLPPEPPEPPIPPEPPQPPRPAVRPAEPPVAPEPPAPPAPPAEWSPRPPIPPLPPLPDFGPAATPPLPPTPPTPATPPTPPTPATPPIPPTPATPPIPPTPPAPPAPPVPPVPPVPRSEDAEVQANNDWHMNWSDGSSRFEVRLHGSVAFNDDLTDVSSMSDEGSLKLRHWSGLVPHTIEIKSARGVITRKYYVAGLERPYDEEARRWLAENLPVLVRRTGLGAEQRVKSILAKKGVGGVLDEIALLGGDHARRLYFNLLVDNANFDAAAVLPVLLKVEQHMTSDYERGQVLQHIASRVPLDQRAARAYVRAMASMKSDYERRRTVSALMAVRPLPSGIADIALTSVADMRSDYERSEVLRTALASGTVEQTDHLFAAVGRMTSSYEKRRVLLEALSGGVLSRDAARGFLMAAATIESDYECSQVLMAYVKAAGVDTLARQPFFAALRTIDADYGRRRVLTELAGKGRLPREVLQSVFDLVHTMRSDYDRAEILLAFVNAHAVEPGARPAFLNAAEQIRSQHEQNRVLAALVRAEKN